MISLGYHAVHCQIHPLLAAVYDSRRKGTYRRDKLRVQLINMYHIKYQQKRFDVYLSVS